MSDYSKNLTIGFFGSKTVDPIGLVKDKLADGSLVRDRNINTRTDERAEMQAAIVELQSMVELGIYYARKNDGGINDAEAMIRVLNNTKKWCE